MFCPKCGNQINEGERFCGKCGAPVEAPGAQAPNPGAPNNSAPKLNLNIPSPNASTPEGKMLLLNVCAAVLYILTLIFWLVNNISASYMGMSQSVSVGETLSESMDIGFINVLTILLIIAAIVMCILPIVLGKLNKKDLQIVQKITSVWTLLWFIIAVIDLSSKTSIASLFGSSVSVGPSFGGWLLILINVGTFALSTFITIQSKKLNQ